MPYRSTEKTRQKKDAKRTAMMQAALQVFAENGYHAATVRDIVSQADVAVGTFYFYFPDKETLFVHLYEETGDFLLQTIQQAINSRATLPKQIQSGLQAYVNIALYEAAVIQLLLVSGAGAISSLPARHFAFREKIIATWQRPLDAALEKSMMPPQNTRRIAEALAGAFDEVILNLLNHPNPEDEAVSLIQDMTQFTLRATAYAGSRSR